MKRLLLRALAVVPILLLVTSFASANSAMQLLFDSTLIAPSSTIGCGAVNFCSNTYLLVDGFQLTISTDTGNGGGKTITLTSNNSNTDLVNPFPSGHTIEIDYAV